MYQCIFVALKDYMGKPSEAQKRREKWETVGATSRSEFPVAKAEVEAARPQVHDGSGFKPGHHVGRPKGSMNKSRQVAEALMGYNGNKVVREILRKALNPEDKDQGMMLKLCLERILPPVREVNIKQQKQTAINVIVEGVQSFVRDVVDAEIVSEGGIDMDDLEVVGSVPDEEYDAILEAATDDDDEDDEEFN